MPLSNKTKVFIFFGILLLAFLYLNVKDPYVVNPESVLVKPSMDHFFGTDYLGRDLYSRIMIGSLYSVGLAILCLVCVCCLSLLLGGLAGMELGLVSKLILTFADILYCLPSILLALVFVGLFANSVWTVILSFVLSWSGKYIRYIRGLVIDIRRQEYIQLAYQRGCGKMQTLLRHILPNLMIALTSLFITDVGRIVLSISGLSFLGIGVQPPQAELGTILYDAKQYFMGSPWLLLPPGLAITIILMASQGLGGLFQKRWEKVL